jgi:hypothetical protein
LTQLLPVNKQQNKQQNREIDMKFMIIQEEPESKNLHCKNKENSHPIRPSLYGLPK